MAITRIDDLAYVPGSDHPKQKLDLFVPAPEKQMRERDHGERGHPVAVFVHGGVWAYGDRKQFANVGEALARNGILTAVLSYRLAPGAKHPAQIEDVAHAVMWMAAHAAEHGGDGQRIVLIGHSAGAQLVSLLGLDDRWLRLAGSDGERARAPIAGIIALCGIYDLDEPFGDPGQDTGKDYVARVFGKRGPVWHEASPVQYLAPKRDLPFMLVMAERDYPGIRSQTVMMEKAMREAGWSPIVQDIAGRDHDDLVGRIGEDCDPMTGEIAGFCVGVADSAP